MYRFKERCKDKRIINQFEDHSGNILLRQTIFSSDITFLFQYNSTKIDLFRFLTFENNKSIG